MAGGSVDCRDEMQGSQVDDDVRSDLRYYASERRPVPDVELVKLRLLLDPLATTARQRVHQGGSLAGRDKLLD